MFYNFLFPQYLKGRAVSFIILFVRLFFGILFFMHGLDKMMNFNELSQTYPSVLGFGSYMTLMVSIFCEFCCSLFLIFGLLVRLSLIPMILVMAVAFFDVHNATFPAGEPSFIYLILLIILYIAGPGRYSLDYLIDIRTQKDEQELNDALPE